MKARLFDHFGIHVHTVEDVGKNPPPGWCWADNVAHWERLRKDVFTAKPSDALPRLDIRRFDFIGVEVDKHGTWARYEESGSPPSSTEQDR
jgi:hypothetical protein